MVLPPFLRFAQTPTPLEKLRFDHPAQVTLYLKRDDLTGSVLSGNKARKLEFIFAEILKQKADTVITCGGVQSNHARATSILAAKFGLQTVLFLHPIPENSQAADGNLFLDRLVGAEVRFISDHQYLSVDRLMEETKAGLQRQGRRPYIIPEGASSELGVWGYITAAKELKAQCRKAGLKPDRIVTAIGSGGTYAGLLIGTKLWKWPVRITGFNVCYDAPYFHNRIAGLIERTLAAYRLKVKINPEEIDIRDGYVGAGYARSRTEELALIHEVARQTGVILDPTYTGKAMFGLLDQLQKGDLSPKEKIIFLHTGGLFGLFPLREKIPGI